MMSTPEVFAQYERYVLGTYARQPMVVVKAKGSRVWDLEGREYLDVFPGWGVSAVGYNHPWVLKAVRGQSTKLIHVSNNYHQINQWRLAKTIVDASFDGRVFFANSGAEVVEAAIKLVRRRGRADGRHEIITMEQSFHGRTMGALSATGQLKYQEGFEPLLPGFVYVPFNDLPAVERAITPRTAAIMLEPIQGEGGVHVAEDDYLRGLRALADQRGLALIVDEVQTGMGRTGAMFAYQHAGISPDIMLLAKGLGGGVPIGAMVVARRLADALGPGSHGSTFGGAPLACACSLAVFEAIRKQALLARAQQMGERLRTRLTALAASCPVVRQVRGRALMVGIELTIDGRPIVTACRERGLLLNCTQERVLRMLPAMTITRAQLDRAVDILEEILMAQPATTAGAGA
jgi:predicted acetylornithine/succinylornithine family transaminase